ncbi:MAG: flagellar basal-body MS-ring/collar protein FliF [Pseudomonadota bacterium]
MQGLAAIWTQMDTQRRVLAGLAVVALLAVLIWLVQLVTRPDMALLYGGIKPSEAATVISALDQRGVLYDVRGEAIYVERGRRDALRMELAGEGLPAAGGAGYELLDNLSGFGTTSQMFDAAYWRAKEGELARTIVASPMIREARVHIATPGSSPFRRDSTPTASVAVTGNGNISNETAKSLQFLVAAAVADLSTENVSVIDTRTGRVLAPIDDVAQTGHSEDREKTLQSRVTRLLEARVGTGNARVEVSIERLMQSETLTERQIDPESRIVISQDSEQLSSTSQGGNEGSVTVASNVPSGDTGASGQNSSEQRTETRERSNFDVSELRRETIISPGAIRRLSVAVLVNNQDSDSAARTAEELEDLRELVAAAVGFDAERGDVISLKALDFTSPGALGTSVGSSTSFLQNLDPRQVIQLGVISIVTLVLGLFVVRPLLLAGSSSADQITADGALTILPQETLLETADALSIESTEEPEDLPSLDGDLPALSLMSAYDEDGNALEGGEAVDRLKELIETRQPDTLEILRSWMEPDTSETEKA